jgi:hypothetical protein
MAGFGPPPSKEVRMKLKLLVGLSGNEYSLAPGDEYDFDGEEVDGKVTGEAGRLIDAGIAVKAGTAEPQAPAAPAAPASKKKGKANVVPPEVNGGAD